MFLSRQYAEKVPSLKGFPSGNRKNTAAAGNLSGDFSELCGRKQNNYQDAVQKIKNIIVDAYRQHRYLEQEECFTQNEKQQMLEITAKNE